MVLDLGSSAFAEGERIPSKYTADGADVSPPLAWGEPPEGTGCFALISDDPDAPVGTWVHWVVYNIPASARGLDEGVPADEKLADGTLQGTTDFGRVGYGGPAPPPGKDHRYFFKLYALDSKLDLAPGAGKKEALAAMEGHVLEKSETMGVYRR